MNVSSKITSAEIREAMRLNFDPSKIWKTALRSPRLLMGLIIISIMLVAALFHDPVQWSSARLLVGLLLVYVGLYVIRYRQIATAFARAVNKAGVTFTIDHQGLTWTQPNGTRTSIPWSAISTWREGTLVFTLGPATNYTVISKAVLGNMQSSELRSLLQAEVRDSLHAGRQFA